VLWLQNAKDIHGFVDIRLRLMFAMEAPYDHINHYTRTFWNNNDFERVRRSLLMGNSVIDYKPLIYRFSRVDGKAKPIKNSGQLICNQETRSAGLVSKEEQRGMAALVKT
jgi:hypothetical protein